MGDFDFLGFLFNGKHSFLDFGIYRTSDGSRYNANMAPTLTEKTAEVPGGNGMYYFGTQHKQRQFSVNIAFDNMSEVTYCEMRKWLSGKEIGELSFDERPYVVYGAKVTGTPTLKTICFDEDGKRVYKGEGTVQFTCYYPYGHTSTKLLADDSMDLDDVELSTSRENEYTISTKLKDRLGLRFAISSNFYSDTSILFINGKEILSYNMKRNQFIFCENQYISLDYNFFIFDWDRSSGKM